MTTTAASSVAGTGPSKGHATSASTGGPLLTEAEFLQLPKAAGKQELIYGRVVTMPPPGFGHGSRQSKIDYKLRQWAEANSAGEIVAEVGFVLQRAPDLVRLPDIAFVAAERVPAEEDRERHFDGPPDLAVEIMSPDDTIPQIENKVDEYLGYGVRLVWVLNPRRRTMNVYERGVPPRVLGERDAVEGGTTLPGFSCTVSDLLG